MMNLPIYRPIYAHRMNQDAPMHMIRKSNNGNVLDEARQMIISDFFCLVTLKMKNLHSKTQNDLETEVKREISSHYGINQKTLSRILSCYHTNGKVARNPRSGRPSLLTRRTKRKIISCKNEIGGRSIRSTAIALKARKISYPLRKTNKKKKYISKSTIHRVIREGKSISIKTKPRLIERDYKQRYDFAKEEMSMTLEQRYRYKSFVDEAFISVETSGSGKLIHHQDGPAITEEQKYRYLKSKRHHTKMLVIGVVALPKMINPLDAGEQGNHKKAKFSPEQNGKIHLARVCEKNKYKRKVSKIVDGVKRIIKEKGDDKIVAANLDGNKYKEMMIGDNGIFDSLRRYFGPLPVIIIQEDGAPGHGYDNLHGRVPTNDHAELEKEAKRRKIAIKRQPSNSPETNPLDLGIWYSLQSRVKEKIALLEENRKGQVGCSEAQLWQIAKECWDDIDPKTIWNTIMVRDKILQAMVENKDKEVNTEPHCGIRKYWGTD